MLAAAARRQGSWPAGPARSRWERHRWQDAAVASLYWTVDGDGPPVVLLHAGGLDSRMLRARRARAGAVGAGAPLRPFGQRQVARLKWGGRPGRGAADGQHDGVRGTPSRAGREFVRWPARGRLRPGSPRARRRPATRGAWTERRGDLGGQVRADRRPCGRRPARRQRAPADAWLRDPHLAPHGFSSAATELLRSMLRDNVGLFVAPARVRCPERRARTARPAGRPRAAPRRRARRPRQLRDRTHARWRRSGAPVSRRPRRRPLPDAGARRMAAPGTHEALETARPAAMRRPGTPSLRPSPSTPDIPLTEGAARRGGGRRRASCSVAYRQRNGRRRGLMQQPRPMRSEGRACTDSASKPAGKAPVARRAHRRQGMRSGLVPTRR